MWWGSFSKGGGGGALLREPDGERYVVSGERFFWRGERVWEEEAQEVQNHVDRTLLLSVASLKEKLKKWNLKREREA